MLPPGTGDVMLPKNRMGWRQKNTLPRQPTSWHATNILLGFLNWWLMPKAVITALPPRGEGLPIKRLKGFSTMDKPSKSTIKVTIVSITQSWLSRQRGSDSRCVWVNRSIIDFFQSWTMETGVHWDPRAWVTFGAPKLITNTFEQMDKTLF